MVKSSVGLLRSTCCISTCAVVADTGAAASIRFLVGQVVEAVVVKVAPERGVVTLSADPKGTRGVYIYYTILNQHSNQRVQGQS